MAGGSSSALGTAGNDGHFAAIGTGDWGVAQALKVSITASKIAFEEGHSLSMDDTLFLLLILSSSFLLLAFAAHFYDKAIEACLYGFALGLGCIFLLMLATRYAGGY